MSDEPVPSSYRRRLVVIAITDYDDGTVAQRTAFSADITAQVAAVEGWWADAALDDERRFTPVRPKQLRTVHDMRAFLIEEDLAAADDDEALVIYITGHGLAPGLRQHFLLLPDSYEHRPLGTAFPTAELITTALDSCATHVLVMVDSCFSGVLENELKENMKALEYSRSSLSSLVVLTSGNNESRPRLREFSTLLAAVHAHCKDESSGYAQSHLSWQEWDTIVNKVFDSGTMANVHYIWPTPSAKVQQAHMHLSPCLPNPGFTAVAPVLDDARSQVGWTRTDLDKYWISRATGQTELADHGWYFTGRTTLVRRMIRFLAGDEGVLIVTGQAGSGKSALLARMVTLSDTRFRADSAYRPFLDTIPEELQVPEGAVDAAVLARNTDPDELTATLYTALTGRPSAATPDKDSLTLLRKHVLDRARQRGEPITVVIDGIDEAKNPTRIITDLLRPLADLRLHDDGPAMRLLLGIRSSPSSTPAAARDPQVHSDLLSLLIRATHADEPIRTDGPDAATDIAAYVITLLQAPHSGDHLLASLAPAKLQALADAVAEEVAPSFLDARIAAEQLRTQRTQPDSDDPHWRGRLREGIQSLLREDLNDVAAHTGVQAEHLVAVLRATAFAQGAGLPWADVWPAAVTALSPHPVEDPDTLIRALRDSRLTGYLSTAMEDGRTVYRPIHERISETLRQAPHTLLGADGAPDQVRSSAEELTMAHRLLVDAFIALLPQTANQPPHPYLRRHLVAHAAAAGALDDAHIPATFLPWESRGNVRGTLGLPLDPADGRSRLVAWSRIEPFLADALPSSRADSLALSNFTVVPPGPEASRPHQLTPRWKDLRVPGNILATTSADIYSLTTFTVSDGTTLLAAGDAEGSVQLWDPVAGTPFGLPLRSRGPFARAMAALPGPGGEPLLAVGCQNGVWVCDPQSGDVIHLPVSAKVRALEAFTSTDGQARLAIGTVDGLVICDPLNRTVLADVGRSSIWGSSINALASIHLSAEQTLLAVGGEGSSVDILDAESLDVVGAISGHGRGVAALTLFIGRDGQLRLATASRSTGTVRIWDPFAGKGKLAAIRQSAAVMQPYPDPDKGILLAVGSSQDGSIRVWDPDTGQEAYQSSTDHTKMVRGLVVIPRLEAAPLIISGSFDRTIRVWSPAFRAQREEQAGPPAVGACIAVLPEPSGQHRIIAAGKSDILSVRSADSGTSLRSIALPVDGEKAEVTALATYTWPGGSTSVIAGLPGGTVNCWTQNQWHRMEISAGQHSRVRALAAFLHGAPGHVVLAAGTSAGAVQYCDLASGAWLSWLRVEGAVRALTALPTVSGDVLAVAAKAVQLCRPDEQPYARLPGRIGTAHALANCPGEDREGPLLATGGSDGTVRVWSQDNLKQEAYPPLRGHNGPISAIATLQTPDTAHSVLITAGANDSTVRLWDFRSGEELMRLVSGVSVTALCVVPAGSIPNVSDPVIAFGGPAGLAAATVRL